MQHLYRTGDLVKWLPDGNMEVIGRIDFQVKVRGIRIELGEIQSRLLKHPSIKEAVVIAWDGETMFSSWMTTSSAIRERLKKSSLA